MTKLLIVRQFPTDKQTVGKLFVMTEFMIEYECNTLELGWHNNKKDVSCIPTGTYTIQKRFSEKYGEHWHIVDVPDRDMILIHTGNFHTQTHGCILIGKGLGDINKDGLQDVTNSKKAMEELNDVLTNNEYQLTIK